LKEFDVWWALVIEKLKVGETIKILLGGDFYLDESDRDMDWELVEEVQMKIRLDSLPDGYWAALRGSAQMYVGVHRSH
jgi:hypothetical protein